MRSYIDVAKTVRDVLELAMAAVKAERLDPEISGDEGLLAVTFIPTGQDGDDFEYLLGIQRRESGLLWIVLYARDGVTVVDSWCELHVAGSSGENIVRKLWTLGRSMSMSSDAEAGLASLELSFRRLSRPRRAS